MEGYSLTSPKELDRCIDVEFDRRVLAKNVFLLVFLAKSIGNRLYLKLLWFYFNSVLRRLFDN